MGGGTDDDSNLVVACQECNAGKSHGILGDGITYPEKTRGNKKRTRFGFHHPTKEEMAAVDAVMFSRENAQQFIRRAIHHEVQFRKGYILTEYEYHGKEDGRAYAFELRTRRTPL